MTLGAISAQSQAMADRCNSQEYKLLDSNTIAVRCGLAVAGFDGGGTIAMEDNGQISAPVMVSVSKGGQWLLVTLQATPSTGVQGLEAQKKYQLSLDLQRSDPTTHQVVLSRSIIGISTALDGSDLCNSKDYKVFDASTILIQCATRMSDSAGSGAISLQGNIGTSTNVTVSTLPENTRWLLIKLQAPMLKGKTKYQLVFSIQAKGDVKVTSNSSTIPIDTNPTVSITRSLLDSAPRTYQVSSHLVFADNGKPLFDNGSLHPIGCNIVVVDYSGKRKGVPAQCHAFSPASSFDNLDPVTVGVWDFELDRNPDEPQLIPYELPGLSNVFGMSFTIDPKSRLTAQKAPATKDASHYYILFSDAAGVGAAPSWVLDGKISPPIGQLHGGFQFTPVALANVGQGTIKGQTNTNTIDFAATLQRVFLPGEKRDRNRLLQEIFFTGGATYETDKQFDRDNLLGVLDLRYNFKGFYDTQAVQTIRQYFKDRKIAKDDGITLQPEDQAIARWGYALDFHTGLETGGSLVDTTVKASTGKATQMLPTFAIVRIVPQIHGLVQYWKFSIDGTVIPRYLATTEYTVIQLKNNSLALKKVNGWNALGTVSGTFNLDSLGHFGITVGYKDGFAPPTFVRVNAVQTGISAKW